MLMPSSLTFLIKNRGKLKYINLNENACRYSKNNNKEKIIEWNISTMEKEKFSCFISYNYDTCKAHLTFRGKNKVFICVLWVILINKI